MVISVMPVDTVKVIDLLYSWLALRIPEHGFAWLEEKQSEIYQGAREQVFLTSFSAVPRYTGKGELNLSEKELEAAQELCSGWSPDHWSVDQVGRVLLLLTWPCDNAEKYLRSLDKLFSTEDVGELIALYKSLPLLPYPEQHLSYAVKGIRSNRTVIFDAIALRNPYPLEYFDNDTWNEMVFKAVLVESPLHLIEGLERRANPILTQMLIDYAHQRWEKDLTVTPELWRVVEPFITDAIASDLERVMDEPDLAQQEAAALACFHSPSMEATAILERDRPDLKEEIENGYLTWETFTQERIIACE
ncbi:MAG: EboA domain-containing protein [Chroococcales cyanobacterium]